MSSIEVRDIAESMCRKIIGREPGIDVAWVMMEMKKNGFRRSFTRSVLQGMLNRMELRMKTYPPIEKDGPMVSRLYMPNTALLPLDADKTPEDMYSRYATAPPDRGEKTT